MRSHAETGTEGPGGRRRDGCDAGDRQRPGKGDRHRRPELADRRLRRGRVRAAPGACRSPSTRSTAKAASSRSGGAKLKLIVADTTSENPTQAASVTRRMIDQDRRDRACSAPPPAR